MQNLLKDLEKTPRKICQTWLELLQNLLQNMEELTIQTFSTFKRRRSCHVYFQIVILKMKTFLCILSTSDG